MLAENRSNTVKHYDYSKSHIIASAGVILKNLQTDYLDAFYCTDRVLNARDEIEAVEN
jgi:predicted oxidoreductase